MDWKTITMFIETLSEKKGVFSAEEFAELLKLAEAGGVDTETQGYTTAFYVPVLGQHHHFVTVMKMKAGYICPTNS